jgi:predicted Zn-dependent peptidase
MKIKSKKIILAVIIFTLTVFHSWGSAADKNKYFILDNGLRVFLEVRDNIPLVNFAFGINVGSKDEGNESSGLVHLLEHLILLGGTHSFTGNQLVEKIRENALYFNAHTGHDLMTLEISVPSASAHTEFAFVLLREKIFNLKLTQEELEKEKKVIREELARIQDDPDKLGTHLALQALFKGHTYGKSVGGEKKIVENATVNALESFYKKYFIPSNCALSVVGDFKIEAMEKKIREVFGKFESPDISMPDFKRVSPLKKTVKIERELDITQAYLVFGLIAPGANDPDKLSMDILTQILGEGVKPLLFNAFRGRRRLIDNLSMRYISLKYGGAVLIHLVLDPKYLNSAKIKLIEFLKTTRTIPYSKEDFLYSQRSDIIDYVETAKTWMRFAYQEYREQALNLAFSYVRYMLTNDDTNKKSYREQMDAIKSSDLKEAASKYLCGRKYVMVTILPKNK